MERAIPFTSCQGLLQHIYFVASAKPPLGALFQNETPARAAEPFEGRASRWFLGPLSVSVNSEALADIDGTVEDIEAKSLEVHAIDGSTEGSA